MNLKPLDEILAQFRVLMGRAAVWPMRWFAAHDVFISYSRSQSIAYALALQQRLKDGGFSVALDLLASLPGTKTPSSVLRQARWSKARVVLVTPKAFESKHIAEEIAEFSIYPEPTVLICEPALAMRIEGAPWRKHVFGIEPLVEAGGAVAFADGKPSDDIFQALLQRLQFMRRERRISWAAGLGAALAIGGTGAGFYYGAQATQESERAAVAQRAASVAGDRAVAAKDAELSASQAAAAARAEALSAGARAASANAQAASSQAIADREAERARRATLASDAVSLALRAGDLMANTPAHLPQALDLARRSVEITPSAGGNAALQAALALMPPLLLQHRTGCSGNQAVFDAKNQVLAMAGNGKLCAFDVARGRPLPDYEPESLQPLGTADHLQFVTDGVLLVSSSVVGESRSIMLLLRPGEPWEKLGEESVQTVVSAAAISPDGQDIAIGNDAGLVGLVHRHADGHWQAGNWIGGLGAGINVRTLVFDRTGQYLLVAGRGALQVMHLPPDRSGGRAQRVQMHRIGEKQLPFATDLPVVLDEARQRVIAAWGGELRILDFPSLSPLQSITLSDVDAVAVAADGRILTHSASGSFGVYQLLENGSLVRMGQPDRTRDSLSLARRVVPAYGGSHVWAHGTQRGGTASWASLRRLDGGEELGRIAHDTYIQHLFPLGDGNGLLSVDGSGFVRLWGDVLAANGSTHHDQLEVGAIAIDPTARRAALGLASFFLFDPKAVRSWDLAPAVERGQLPWPDRIVSMRLGGPEAPALDALGPKGWLRAVGWPAGAPVEQLPAAPVTGRACRSMVSTWGDPPSGPIVAASEGELWLAEGSTKDRGPHWRRLPVPELDGLCAGAISVDHARRFAAISTIGSRKSRALRVQVISLETGSAVLETSTNSLVHAMAFDRDARILAVATTAAPASTSERGLSELQLYSVADRRLLAKAPLGGSGVAWAVCVSPDGSMVASEGDAIAQVWRLEPAGNGRVGGVALVLETSRVLGDTAKACRFSSDGSRVVFGDTTGLRTVVLDRTQLLEEARRRLGPLAAR